MADDKTTKTPEQPVTDTGPGKETPPTPPKEPEKVSVSPEPEKKTEPEVKNPQVSVYNFSEIGDETPNAPAIPATHGAIKSKNFVVQNVGDVLRLKKLESFHFMMAGPEGAVVDEWACYHDNDGLRFTNTKAAL